MEFQSSNEVDFPINHPESPKPNLLKRGFWSLIVITIIALIGLEVNKKFPEIKYTFFPNTKVIARNPIIPILPPQPSLNPDAWLDDISLDEPEEKKPEIGEQLGPVLDDKNKWLQSTTNSAEPLVLPMSANQPPLPWIPSQVVTTPTISVPSSTLPFPKYQVITHTERKSIDTEMETVAKFLTVQNPVEAPYLRFFTMYAMPTEPNYTIGYGGRDTTISLRQAGFLVLSFVLNSCANFQHSKGTIITPTMVPGSDTLCYINILDYGWNKDQWDRVSKVQPYVAEPLVNHSAYNLGRLVGGNMLFRGDWFIVNATDAQRQLDAKINELIYYDLLFDNAIPKNGNDFRKNIGVDLKTSLKDNIDRRVILEAGTSGVSIATGGNRKIQSIRTPFGYYWETFDTKNLDFFNNLELGDDQKDAGELIASHKNGTQIYFLVNDKDNRVDFADNGLVDDTSLLKAKSLNLPIEHRVRTSISCINCHLNGINQIHNDINESIKEGVTLNVLVQPKYDLYKDFDEYRKAKDRYLILDRKFVNNGIDSIVENDNKIYEQAIRECNGLIPSQNAKLFMAICQWYDKPLFLPQAALECGVSPAVYIERTVGCISARVNRVAANDKFSIPRKYWDSLDPAGDYAHSILTIRLHSPEGTKFNVNAIIKPTYSNTQKKILGDKVLLITRDCNITVTENGQEICLGSLKKGELVPYIKFDGRFYRVDHEGHIGFIYKNYCTVAPPGGNQ